MQDSHHSKTMHTQLYMVFLSPIDVCVMVSTACTIGMLLAPAVKKSQVQLSRIPHSSLLVSARHARNNRQDDVNKKAVPCKLQKHGSASRHNLGMTILASHTSQLHNMQLCTHRVVLRSHRSVVLHSSTQQFQLFRPQHS
jgi:hypothetical protein